MPPAAFPARRGAFPVSREILPARTREARRAACNELTDATQRQLYDQIERATQRGNYPNHRNAERRCDGPASQQYEQGRPCDIELMMSRMRFLGSMSRYGIGPARICREESELGRGLPDPLRKPLSEHLLREQATR